MSFSTVFLNDFDYSFQNTCSAFFRIFKELFQSADREIYLKNIFWKTKIDDRI